MKRRSPTTVNSMRPRKSTSQLWFSLVVSLLLTIVFLSSTAANSATRSRTKSRKVKASKPRVATKPRAAATTTTTEPPRSSAACPRESVLSVTEQQWQGTGERRVQRRYQVTGKNGFWFASGMTIDADGSPRAFHRVSSKGLDDLKNAGRRGNWWGILTYSGETSGRPVVQGPNDPARRVSTFHKPVSKTPPKRSAIQIVTSTPRRCPTSSCLAQTDRISTQSSVIMSSCTTRQMVSTHTQCTAIIGRC
jgi:hypothetical protein